MSFNMKSLINISVVLIVIGFFAGCGKEEPLKSNYVDLSGKKKKIVKAKKKEVKKYVYRSSNRRDPFLTPGLKADSYTKAGSVDISMLELKGIIDAPEKKEKYALVSGPGGESYIVKGGKLINLNNKVVPGVSGTIKEDRVILVTKRHYLRVLKFKNKKASIPGLKLIKAE